MVHNSVPLRTAEQDDREHQHNGLRNGEGVPHNAASKQSGQRKNDDGVYNKAPQKVDDVRLAGAFCGVEVGRNHGVERHDQEAERVDGHGLQGIVQRFVVRAEQLADRSAEKQEQHIDERAADEVDDESRVEIELEVPAVLRAVAVSNEGLQPLRGSEEDRNGKGSHIGNDGVGIHADIADLGNQHLIHPERGNRRCELRNTLRKAPHGNFLEQGSLRFISAEAQMSASADKVEQQNQHGHGLRNACGNGRAFESHLQGKDEKPIAKNVQSRAEHDSTADQNRRTVVAAKALKGRGHAGRYDEHRVPEKVLLRHAVIDAGSAQQPADRPCQAGSDKAQHHGDEQRAGHCVHERVVRVLVVAAPEADGNHGNAADGRKLEERIDNHDERHHQIDRAQRVGSDAASHKNPIHNGEQEKADAAKHGGRNVLDQVL